MYAPLYGYLEYLQSIAVLKSYLKVYAPINNAKPFWMVSLFISTIVVNVNLFDYYYKITVTNGLNESNFQNWKLFFSKFSLINNQLTTIN